MGERQTCLKGGVTVLGAKKRRRDLSAVILTWALLLLSSNRLVSFLFGEIFLIGTVERPTTLLRPNLLEDGPLHSPGALLAQSHRL